MLVRTWAVVATLAAVTPFAALVSGQAGANVKAAWSDASAPTVAGDTNDRTPPPVGSSPFTADGPWNAAIPADPVIDPASSAMVAKLASGAKPGIANLYDYGARIYRATSDTPRYRVECSKRWGACALEAEPGGVPIPDGAVGNGGSDNAMTVIDRAAGRAYCFWRYGNDTRTTSWGGAYNLDTDGGGTHDTGCTGSGLPSLGGPVRVAEMEAGYIPHALVFATRFCQGPDNGPNFRFPAGKTDGKWFGTGAVPEGARIQLDPTINVNAIPGITTGEKIVARALQTYGAYAGDCGAANMSFTFEDPKNGSDPYPSLGFTWDYYDMDHIPWNRLRVLRTWNGH